MVQTIVEIGIQRKKKKVYMAHFKVALELSSRSEKCSHSQGRKAGMQITVIGGKET